MITLKKKYISKNMNSNQLVLDIETTGLDSSLDYLVLLGLIYQFDGKTYIIQHFAEDNSEEIRLLKIYKKLVENKEIITYNGDIFDIPFLNQRLIKYNMDPIFPDSLDIYKVISSKRKYFDFQSLRLMDIEKEVGIYRNDPSRYKVISKLTEDIKKRNNPKPIMVHNENDLIATEKLANAKEFFKNELSINTKLSNIYLKDVNINNDICHIIIESAANIGQAYFLTDNYEFRANKNEIEINIQVIYGKLDEATNCHVAFNNFMIKNQSNVSIDPNLLIIRENYKYNYKNILLLCKKIIQNHL